MNFLDHIIRNLKWNYLLGKKDFLPDDFIIKWLGKNFIKTNKSEIGLWVINNQGDKVCDQEKDQAFCANVLFLMMGPSKYLNEVI